MARAGRSLPVQTRVAAAVCCCLDCEERSGELRLIVTNEGGPELVRPLTVTFRLPEGRLPSRASLLFDNSDLSLKIHSFADGLGRITLLPSLNGADLMVENRSPGGEFNDRA